MISGTSKVLSKSGPVALQITVNFKKYKKNTGTSLKNMDLGNLRIWKSQNFRKSCVPNLKIFFYESSFFLEYDNMMKWWKVEDDEFLEIHFAGGISWKAWIWIPFRSKTWNENVVNRTNFFIFEQSNPYHQSTYRFPRLHPISAPWRYEGMKLCGYVAIWLSG